MRKPFVTFAMLDGLCHFMPVFWDALQPQLLHRRSDTLQKVPDHFPGTFDGYA
jgi:hypothetical protein